MIDNGIPLDTISCSFTGRAPALQNRSVSYPEPGWQTPVVKGVKAQRGSNGIQTYLELEFANGASQRLYFQAATAEVLATGEMDRSGKKTKHYWYEAGMKQLVASAVSIPQYDGFPLAAFNVASLDQWSCEFTLADFAAWMTNAKVLVKVFEMAETDKRPEMQIAIEAERLDDIAGKNVIKRRNAPAAKKPMTASPSPVPSMPAPPTGAVTAPTAPTPPTGAVPTMPSAPTAIPAILNSI